MEIGSAVHNITGKSQLHELNEEAAIQWTTATQRSAEPLVMPASSSESSTGTFVFKTVYFFSGAERKGDIRHWLQQECNACNYRLDMVEFDLLRNGLADDLSGSETQKSWILRLKEFDCVIVTPPCGSFSRAQWANNFGPHPVRSSVWPDGFPWLSHLDLERAELGNNFANFMFSILKEVDRLQASINIVGFAEHPEDLGRVRGKPRGSTPASIWQRQDHKQLLLAGWWSGAFQQGSFGAETQKPTRCLANSRVFEELAPASVPKFCKDGFYIGPVTKTTLSNYVSLLRTSGESGPFKTAASGAYPSAMCRKIAELIMKAHRAWRPMQPPSEGGILKAATASDSIPQSPQTGTFSQAPGNGSTLPKALINLLEDKLLEIKVQTLQSRVILDPPDNLGDLPVPQVTIPVDKRIVSNSWDWIEGIDFVKTRWWSDFPPLRTFKTPNCPGRPLVDGGGLCSPGRWKQKERVFPPQASWLTGSIDAWLETRAGKEGETFLQTIVYNLVAGRYTEHPFKDSLSTLKDAWVTMMKGKGLLKTKMIWDRGPTIDYSFLHMVAEFLEDPDYGSMAEFCRGVRVGVGVTLKRTPEIWPPKTKWALGGYGEAPVFEQNSNYPSAAVFRKELLEDLEDQEKRGWALPIMFGKAVEEYKDVYVASLAVIMEAKDKHRTLLDGSNRVQINHRIKVLDQEQCPSSLDVQGAVTGDHALKTPIISLVIDVEKAHQQVPIDERDWGLVGCSADPMPADPMLKRNWNIHLKTVGTYGISSASWQWARAASLIQRLSYQICRMAYLFRFADDFLLLSGSLDGVRFTRPILRFLVFIGLLDLPVKWPKTRGGLKAEFVGYLFDFENLVGGLTERRCSWLGAWALKIADQRAVVTRELRGGLGRFSFSAALLRMVLPFLGPFYAWIAVLGSSDARELPAALVILLRWLAKQVLMNPMVPLRLVAPARFPAEFKADARADGDEVVVGGFMLLPGAALSDCPWFSYRINRENSPWAFCKADQAYRTIAALELFATLLCCILFVPVSAPQQISKLYFSGATDNQGNEAIVIKNMSSKFPVYLILLELTEQLQVRNLVLDLVWQTRELNIAADNLSNENFSQFTESLRINTPIQDLKWLIFPTLLKEALELEIKIQELKAHTKPKRLVSITKPKTKKRKVPGLKITDPW
jgi:hypothetical protein